MFPDNDPAAARTMTAALWFTLVGGLMLTMGLSTTLLKRLPVTTAILVLAVGLLCGPSGLGLFHFNPMKESGVMQVLTEVAVLISLFAAGVKMPVPFTFVRWRLPLRLATVSMVVTVGMVAAFACLVLDLPLGAGVLLGAILAPTDPVLATDVQLRHPGEADPLRFTLTCEAGLNDGTAFPFVVLGLGLLGLHDLGENGLQWLVVDVLWATAGGVAIGVAAGVALARVGWWLRSEPHRHQLLDDFLGLGLIAVVYGLSEQLHAWGFLAVFAAAVALRQTELKLANVAGHRPDNRSLAQVRRADSATPDPETAPTVSHGALVFKEHLERLSELLLVLLLGGMLFIDSWSWGAFGLAMFVFFVARPAGVLLGLLGSGAPTRLLGLTAWFGVRGIGSLYYLMFALQSGLPETLALQLTQLTLIVVTLSIVLHGTSVKPLLHRYWRHAPGAAAPP